MEQRVSMVTLGVADYARAKAFYEAVGWSAALDIQETACFKAGALILVLWERGKLAGDVGVPDEGPGFGGFALAQNVRSREEVHATIDLARAAGAEVTREPAETFYR